MIIGYGVCGGGEAKRYMRKTLDEFKRLCDDVLILGNNITKDERDLIKEYGFKLFEDNREWGKQQWLIKQDFLQLKLSKIVREGDMLVCLDMDEVFCPHITKRWIQNAPLNAYHVFVVDLWGDEEHYKPESCFWNVRIWRWNGEISFKQKPVHCGLAPEWTYHYHRHAPFILKHYGLMKKEDRNAKILRYEKYDPSSKYLDVQYYEMLKTDRAKPFDENDICSTIEKEVADYKQTKPRDRELKKTMRYAYIKNPAGMVLDIPENNLAETLKRQGFEFVAWADDVEKKMENLFEGVPLVKNEDHTFEAEQKKEEEKPEVKVKKVRKTKVK